MLESAQPGDERLLCLAGGLSRYDPSSPRWAESGKKVARALVTLDPVVLGPWLDVLRDVRGRLTRPLASIFKDRNRSESEHTLATSILVDYAADEPEILADLLMAAEPQSFLKLFRVAKLRAERAVPLFQAELAKRLTSAESGSESAKDQLAQRQARAAIGLVRLGKAESIWPLLRHSPDPRLRSFIINWLGPLGVEPKVILVELGRLNAKAQPATAPEKLAVEVALLHPETSIRRALIITLGTYGPDALSPGERTPLVATLLNLYKNGDYSNVTGRLGLGPRN